jgi:hypothetical protein
MAMKKLLLGLALAIGMVLLAAMPVFADTMTMPAPGPGFGQCVAMMVTHGMMTGAAVGQCVSSMANGVCTSCAGLMP